MVRRASPVSRSASWLAACTQRASCCCSRSATTPHARMRFPAYRSCASSDSRRSPRARCCASATGPASTPHAARTSSRGRSATRWRCSSSCATAPAPAGRSRRSPPACTACRPAPRSCCCSLPRTARRRCPWWGQPPGKLGLDARALEPAESAGLIHAAHGTITFRHPLVRSAVVRLGAVRSSRPCPYGARRRPHRGG